MKLFGTDGLRGRAGEFPLDPASVRLVGVEVGRRLATAGAGAKAVLGGDTRASTPELLAELAGGLAAGNCEVACAGVLTTPGVAEVVLALSAGAGISVSASHNPFDDNGIKIFGSDGRKWPDEWEEELERRLLASQEGDGERGRGGKGETARIAPSPTRPLPPSVDLRLAEIYLQRLAEHVPVRLQGLPILVDTGNGAAYQLASEALSRAGASVTAICNTPDGTNINAGCGALHPQVMASATREQRAAMGVALDGDADRSIFADENGRILDGDDVLWIIAREWRRKRILAPAGIVGTVMSNFGLQAALEREGIPFQRAAVGDRNVARLMEESGAAVGGETSGHILLPFSPAGDGIQTALLLASIVSESGGPLSRLATLEKVPQSLRNIRVARRLPLGEIPGLTQAMTRAREELDRRGRILLRYSGTEPLLRILVEGLDAEQVNRIAEDLETIARRELAPKLNT